MLSSAKTLALRTLAGICNATRNEGVAVLDVPTILDAFFDIDHFSFASTEAYPTHYVLGFLVTSTLHIAIGKYLITFCTPKFHKIFPLPVS